MNNRYYVLTVTKTAKDTETRDFSPYNDATTALRKYHEALMGIGTGLKAICVLLLDPWLNVIKRETWTIPTEPENIVPDTKPENTEE